MPDPPLLFLPSETDYRNHFINNYCKGPILTFDDIPVWFNKHIFDHAFYESSNRDKVKDNFSFNRAERMDWIKATLKASSTTLYQGWNASKKKYRNDVRVHLAFDDYVVITSLLIKSDGSYKGKFRTAFVANNSILKIKKSPLWIKK